MTRVVTVGFALTMVRPTPTPMPPDAETLAVSPPSSSKKPSPPPPIPATSVSSWEWTVTEPVAAVIVDVSMVVPTAVVFSSTDIEPETDAEPPIARPTVAALMIEVFSVSTCTLRGSERVEPVISAVTDPRMLSTASAAPKPSWLPDIAWSTSEV